MKYKNVLSLIAVLMAVVFSFSSCEKNEDDEDTNPLVGTWVGSETVSQGALQMKVDVEVVFESNKTYVLNYTVQGIPAPMKEAGTYSYTSDEIILTNEKGEKKTSKYSINGNKLKFNITHMSMNFEFELTKK